MGIVVLRSTTPCVAVSSRSNSNLLTVISMVVVPVADTIASTGITQFPRPCDCADYSTYIKTKSTKTSCNRAATTKNGNFPASPAAQALLLAPQQSGTGLGGWTSLRPESGPDWKAVYPPNCSVSLFSMRF